MGSSSRGSYVTAHDLTVLREEARRRIEDSRADAEINSLLQDKLAAFNDRDAETINSYLEAIESALSSEIEGFDRLLFGGSVAKHTYVDGLSDVDALVILKHGAEGSSEAAKELLRDTISARVPRTEIDDIRIGQLAVTLRYRDGTEIQLLPAVESAEGVRIPSRDGGWKAIRPREFSRMLTEANQRQGGGVVPAIKLAKAAITNRMEDRALSGYHIEALAVSAFSDYTGPRTPRAMLRHLLRHASEKVLSPLPDPTGQSSFVDASLGTASSMARRSAARELRRIADTVESSRSMSEWSALFE